MSSLKKIQIKDKYVLMRTTRTNCIVISEELEEKLGKGHKPIIWNNDGVYGVINAKWVDADVQLRKDLRKARVYMAPLVYYWQNVHLIPEKVCSPVRYAVGFSKREDQTP